MVQEVGTIKSQALVSGLGLYVDAVQMRIPKTNSQSDNSINPFMREHPTEGLLKDPTFYSGNEILT